MAQMAYSEQVGLKRQAEGSVGESLRLYKRRKYSNTFFMFSKDGKIQ